MGIGSWLSGAKRQVPAKKPNYPLRAPLPSFANAIILLIDSILS
jgi:hypothetical protein